MEVQHCLKELEDINDYINTLTKRFFRAREAEERERLRKKINGFVFRGNRIMIELASADMSDEDIDRFHIAHSMIEINLNLMRDAINNQNETLRHINETYLGDDEDNE